MKVFKNIRNHWQAVTETELNAEMVLRIVTMKKHSGYTGTTVTAMKKEKGLLVYVPGSDYALNVNNTLGRCTQALVTGLHVEALKRLDDIKIEAKHHYAMQGANHA